MPAAVIPDEGMRHLIDRIKAQSWKVRLYINNYTPVKGSVAANFTATSVFGLEQQSPNWGATNIDGNEDAVAISATLTFTRTSTGTAQTIYGWYVFEDIYSKVICARRLTTPKVIQNAGENIVITITLYVGDLP